MQFHKMKFDKEIQESTLYPTLKEGSSMSNNPAPKVRTHEEFKLAKAQLVSRLKALRRREWRWFSRTVDDSLKEYVHTGEKNGVRRRCWPIEGTRSFYITRQEELVKRQSHSLVAIDYHELSSDEINEVYAAMVAMIAKHS